MMLLLDFFLQNSQLFASLVAAFRPLLTRVGLKVEPPYMGSLRSSYELAELGLIGIGEFQLIVIIYTNPMQPSFQGYHQLLKQFFSCS